MGGTGRGEDMEAIIPVGYGVGPARRPVSVAFRPPLLPAFPGAADAVAPGAYDRL
ncbi:hypothetical protein GCM10010232_69790 [Streptomyces amakusaensis]